MSNVSVATLTATLRANTGQFNAAMGGASKTTAKATAGITGLGKSIVKTTAMFTGISKCNKSAFSSAAPTSPAMRCWPSTTLNGPT